MSVPGVRIESRLADAVGGRARLRVIAILAAVLALDSADKSSVGAVAPQLERSLGIGNVQVGLLATVTTAVAALATLPLGILSDRVHRVQLLTGAVLLWSVAVFAGGLSGSFLALLATRAALGVIAAAAGPAIGSLIGDLFPTAERARIYGFVLAGELVGSGLGFLVSGEIGALVSWRYAFLSLGVMGLALAVVLARFLSEPERGGGSRLPAVPGSAAARAGGTDVATDLIAAAGIGPEDRRVLRADPAEKPLRWAVRYILAVPTNRVLIVASALGYFFLSGLRTFAVVFFSGRFNVPQGVASGLVVVLGSGAIIGVLLTGRLADRAIGRGHPSARPVLAGLSFLAAAVLILPALLVSGLLIAAPLLFLGAGCLGGANPPLDAARLDIMHHRLRGRAEAVRTVCRSALEALAPLCFGVVSVLFGAAGSVAGGHADAPGGIGLDHTLLVMLVAPVGAGLLMCLRARRTYLRDVATALASERHTDAALRGAGPAQ